MYLDYIGFSLDRALNIHVRYSGIFPTIMTAYSSMNLRLFGNETNSVFALNGADENSATYAIGWTLSKSPDLLRATIKDLMQLAIEPEQTSIELQKHGEDKGFTDIEIVSPNACHVIIEAKRHWELPSTVQLERYANRLKAKNLSNPLIVSLSAASQDYAARHLLTTINKIPLVHRSWADLQALVRKAYGRTNSYYEKIWLRELEIHLKGYVSMKNPRDNMAFVVVLSASPIKSGSDYTWIDVVHRDKCYFHPVGNRWPVVPPNYVAFRYEGALQGVHHIESYEVVTDLSSVNENWPETNTDHFVYKLGPGMKPPTTIKNGSICPVAGIGAQSIRCSQGLLKPSVMHVMKRINVWMRIMLNTYKNYSLSP